MTVKSSHVGTITQIIGHSAEPTALGHSIETVVAAAIVARLYWWHFLGKI
jgi:hypothetical protein